LLQQERWEEALEASEGWIRLGYAPEPAFRALMHAHAGLGDQASVSAAYQRCVDSLDRELSVDPSSETQQLYEQIRHAALERPVPTPTTSTPEPALRQPSFLDDDQPSRFEKPVFVAREDELVKLEGFLQRSLANQGRVVFITGEAGSGKTALFQEFTLRAQEAHPDLIVASGNCNAHTGIGDPYLPFREILELLPGDVEARWAAGTISREHVRQLWRSLPLSVQTLLDCGPDLIDTFVPGAPLLERAAISTPAGSGWLVHLAEFLQRKEVAPTAINPKQSDLFEQYTRLLQAISRQTPLVLVLDDLQWADLGSINLLFHLGRHLSGFRILILGAYRSEEVALGREGGRHPLVPMVNELQRQYGDISVNVDQAERRSFLEALLDSELNRLDTPFRDMLYRQTHGQPMFTIELLRGMYDRGDLVQDQDGFWVEGPNLDWNTMPARVEAVIAERIGRLDEPLRAALRVASVEGETFTAEVVARVQESGEREISGLLSRELDKRHRLIRAHSIQRIDGQLLSSYRFQHILVQKYLYSSLDEVERVYLHEQVGMTLEELYTGQREIANISPQLVRHFQEARITEKAVHYLHLAGEKAVHMSAHQEAIVHLTQGLALLMTMPDTPDRAEKELALLMTLNMAWLGVPGPEWENACNRAIELCRQTGDIPQLSRIMGDLSIIYYVRSELHRARELAEGGLSLAQDTGDPLFVALAHWYLGFIFFATGEYTTSLEHLEHVASFYDPEKHHRTSVFQRGVDGGLSALAYCACTLWCLGYPDQAVKKGQEALALARALGHPFTLGDVLSFAGCMLNIMRRDAQELKERADEMMKLAQEKVPSWMGAAIRDRGQALVMLDRVDEGLEDLSKGEANHFSLGIRLNLTLTYGSIAMAYAKKGQPERGLTFLDIGLAHVGETGEHHWEAELHRLKGELLLALDDRAGAEASFQEAIQVARRQHARSWELRSTISLARLWQEQGRRDEARGMLGEIYAWFSEGFDTPDLLEAKALLEELA